MALRLELNPVKDPENMVRQRWYLEQGRRTLGRSAECDWQVPDPQCLVSKLHCLIEADRNGFVLHDKSANGSLVDGVLVREGDSVRLSHGTVIELSGLAFTVSVTGEMDPEFTDPDADIVLGDEHLTISSILADVAPSSPKSHGLRGCGDAWQEPVSDANAVPGSNGKPSLSRNVEIGWRGPPETTRDAVLPEDWNTHSDFISRFEHAPATRASIVLARNLKTDPSAHEAYEPALPAAAMPQAPHPDEPRQDAAPAAGPAPAADLLQQLEGLTECFEEACHDFFATFDLETPRALPSSDLLELPRDKAVPARLEATLSMLLALRIAVCGLIDEMGRTMEPSIVEARVDAMPGRVLWRSERTYWQAFKTHFERDGKRMSLRDVIREAMMRSLNDHTANNIRQERIPGGQVEAKLDK
ncbi:hypothetical protein ATN84_24810 [Paramesorhizobium deserti]|uniref:FHA domain-containing protein n=1 Tax=Paramesorhizobium deserti TaxID=1494590 RepID=A0A135HXL6_9HYPH|nr:FHA domain-containing protein [Paramesorhizobium deserti]KXF77939.1 hypothetical protein ATN84_24810 [Paramesorhizobium deserti]